jgi:hypothetical protein
LTNKHAMPYCPASTRIFSPSLTKRNESTEHYGMGRYGPRNSDVKGTGVRPGRTTPHSLSLSAFRTGEAQAPSACVRSCSGDCQEGTRGQSLGRLLNSFVLLQLSVFINNEGAHQLAIAHAAELSLSVRDYLRIYSV